MLKRILTNKALKEDYDEFSLKSIPTTLPQKNRAITKAAFKEYINNTGSHEDYANNRLVPKRLMSILDYNMSVIKALKTSDNKLMLIGNFEWMNEKRYHMIVRINLPNLTIDESFFSINEDTLYINDIEETATGGFVIAGNANIGVNNSNRFIRGTAYEVDYNGRLVRGFARGGGSYPEIRTVTIIPGTYRWLLTGVSHYARGESPLYLHHIGPIDEFNNYYEPIPIGGGVFSLFYNSVSLSTNYNFKNGTEVFDLKTVKMKTTTNELFMSHKNLIYKIDLNNITQASEYFEYKRGPAGQSPQINGMTEYNNKYYIYGSFDRYRGQDTNNLVILNRDFTIFKTFPFITKPLVYYKVDDSFTSIAFNSDGSFFIGGSFELLNTKKPGLIKFNASNQFISTFNLYHEDFPGADISTKITILVNIGGDKVLASGVIPLTLGVPPTFEVSTIVFNKDGEIFTHQ